MYPVDIYFLNIKIEGIPKGIYHYLVYKNEIGLIKEFQDDIEITTFINDALYANNRTDMEIQNASVICFYVALINRTSFKYKDKGIKLCLLDTGALLHQSYMVASSLDIDCCATEGYINNVIENAIGTKSYLQQVFSVLILG